ncbi:hypothetical protein EMPS_03889 [Entomortierella parvispora]|uniref:Uncharacterized protein n=1 Tax=Entomortierella parvispora TaxID=205924 RepID=A0A9P3H7L0_9FUNG|nr:hypothetical protein EMPS_03889 [Entomortierella parvispora]
MGKVHDTTTTFTHRANIDDAGTSSDLPDYSAVSLESHHLSADICCISLHGNDKIRLIEAPFDLIDSIRETILDAWGPIQKEERIPPAHQFKLSGYPWVGSGSEGVKSRRLLYRLLKTMVERGWNLIQAADVSKDSVDLDAMFFERMTPGLGASVVDRNVDMFAVSFNKTDVVRLIDAPLVLTAFVRDVIAKNWSKGYDNKSNQTCTK